MMTDEELVAALLQWLVDRYGTGGALELRGFREDADALARRVRRIAEQRAAEELRKAADWIWDDLPARASASAELHARADILDPVVTIGPGTGRALSTGAGAT